jgi:hypothetical protein
MSSSCPRNFMATNDLNSNSSAMEFKYGLSMSNQLVPFTDRAPAIVAAAGARVSYRFLEFFTAQIRNQNTRRAKKGQSGSLPSNAVFTQRIAGFVWGASRHNK